jgi:uncharacterized coiled-coil DUF342 family protein
LKERIKEVETAREFLKMKADNLQAQLDGAHKETEKLNSVRVALKDQTKLQDRIDRLESIKQDLERQLRFHTLSF